MVQFLVLFILSLGAHAKMDAIHAKAYLGERDQEGYHERYYPIVDLDFYRGNTTFRDDEFFRNYFNVYLLPQENSLLTYLRSELNAGLACPNEVLSRNMDDVRYAYRLITLSYLLEGQWHMHALANHFNLKASCQFDLKKWAQTCSPKHPEMKKFLSRLLSFNPRYAENFSSKYRVSDWLNEFKQKKFQWYSHYRLKNDCADCSGKKLAQSLKVSCEQNEALMTKICQEEDEIYGLSTQRDAYFLLGRSNIINTMNQTGEAQGCLRRFSEAFAHKEARYPELRDLFPAIRDFLKTTHHDRFMQGRAFFFGSGKEYDQKGLANFYVKEQPFQAPINKKDEPTPVVVAQKTEVKAEPVKAIEMVKPEAMVEIKTPVKSAFLQAAEVRASQNLSVSPVDMLKLKYDYVFSLHMINNLSEKLKIFMGREALKEMVTYDKLGSKEGPVPLLFIKFMIDMEEHQGLWNLVTVLGSRFYVSNEIDPFYKPSVEYVEIVNDDSTGNTWQLNVIRPY